ncbi:11892_t:CDS:2, partial [Diversispora eburnea]
EIASIFADDKIKATRNIKDAQKRQKDTHDRKIRIMANKTGDMVLEYRSDLKNVHGDKFQSRWTGLYYIHRVLGNGLYILRRTDGEIFNHRPVHGNRLKFYKQRDLISRGATGGATRTNMQVTEGFYKRINQIRRELLSISREAQIVLNKTGIHLIAEGKTVNLAELAI